MRMFVCGCVCVGGCSGCMREKERLFASFRLPASERGEIGCGASDGSRWSEEYTDWDYTRFLLS